MKTTITKLPEQQSRRRLNPLNDYLFCKVMGEKGSEVQLLGFLNAVLGRSEKDKIVSIDIIENKTLSAETIGDKSSILDVRAVLQGGTRLNIEVQLRNFWNLDRRSLFYWSKEFTKSLKSGQDYCELPATIAINIINFNYLETENFHTVFHLREEKEPSLILTDALEIHFLNMVKWRKLGNKDIKNEPLHRWLTWFDKSSPAEQVEEVISMDLAIFEAEKRQAYLSGDEDLIRAYDMREMAISDQISRENYAYDKGFAEGEVTGEVKGEAKGEAKRNLEIAQNSLAEGLPIKTIQKITGLDLDTIKQLTDSKN